MKKRLMIEAGIVPGTIVTSLEHMTQLGWVTEARHISGKGWATHYAELYVQLSEDTRAGGKNA